ncbi:exonuclease SbcC [Saccharicrinis carchari]|uniref:Exonuclease SbcC n=1 Tax=Saccharicrinis carchari TaxID=1168039 RepID=A0A521DP35_SACCC|nr:SMC family ATPase [Saccharicrinis carchari]SMO72841.1 exonuclease SbcC [Saccharicrinis carchari]
MIPIKLTFEGLYSYQHRQTIDFEKLTSNHIFGIFGTVGSGKSSILEAITFALYGKTDRLLLSGDNRNYNMMNLKSNQLFIAFDFTAGKNGEVYRVQASAKRNSKRFDDVKKIDRALYKKINDKFIPISQEELESTIGLSYDNFKRTIIIPQGKFQEFLQLKSSERTQMMKELFGLQKYELSAKVKNLELENNASIQNLSGRLEQLGEVSVQQQKELQLQLKEIENNLQVLLREQIKHDQAVLALEKLKENTAQLSIYQKKADELNKQKESIIKLQKDIGAYEYCIIHFKNTLESITVVQQKTQALQGEINADQLLLQKTQTDLNQLNIKFEQISQEYKTIERIKKEIDDLGKLSEAKRLILKINSDNQRLKKGEAFITELTHKLKSMEVQEKELMTTLSELKKQRPDIETINRAQQWHLHNKNLNTLIDDTQQEIKTGNEQSSKLMQQLRNNLQQAGFSPATDDLKQWLEELSKSTEHYEEQLKNINKQRDSLLVQSGLETYALQLTDGRACPLCGSEHHPKPHNAGDIRQQIKTYKEKAEKTEALLQHNRKLTRLIERYAASNKPIQTQLKTLDAKVTRILNEAKEHQNKIVPQYKEEELLLKAAKTYTEINNAIDADEKKLLQLRERYAREVKNTEKYNQELIKIEREIDKNQSAKEILLRNIPDKLINNLKETSSEQITGKVHELQSIVSKTTMEYEHLRKQLEEHQKVAAVLQSKIDINKKHLQSENKHLDALQLKLEADIANSSYSTKDNILSILSLQLNIEASKQKIQDFHNNHQLIHNEIQKLILALNKQTYHAEKHQKAISLAAEYKKEIDAAHRKHGKTETTLSELNKKLTLKKEITEELAKLKLRAADIDTLRKLFYKSGFVNYISSVYLQNLCVAANQRFYKMTRQSLSLELSQDNSFEVRDYLNGGKLRSVKTLSGGQTFQAALSLALALADNIQNLTQTQRNFFFLDEGFGSLDKDSLQVVFSTLKNLRNENRIVGVISHVEEMQQEIPTFLNIVQNPETGSHIQESWKT